MKKTCGLPILSFGVIRHVFINAITLWRELNVEAKTILLMLNDFEITEIGFGHEYFIIVWVTISA